VRESGRIFLEAAPRGLNPVAIAEAIRATPGITRLADFHVWEITSGMPALSAHIYANPDVDCHEVRRRVEAMLHDRFALTHTTLQTDHGTAGQGEAGSCAFESRDEHGTRM
jgi:cobalt-zinc-cadmium efflux system protein